MISDEKDDKDLELETGPVDDDGTIDVNMETEASFDDDISDVESLAAGMEDDFGSDLDVDITGDEEIDFADEEEDEKGRPSVDVKKMALPALVIVAALGIGGYIIMNPEILTGAGRLKQPKAPYVAQAQAPAQPQSAPFAASPAQEPEQQKQAQADIAEPPVPAQGDAPKGGDSMFGLPQPTVNQNEVPRPPGDDMDAAMVADITEEKPADLSAPDMAAAPEITEAEKTAAPEMPVTPDKVADTAPDQGAAMPDAAMDADKAVDMAMAAEPAAAPDMPAAPEMPAEKAKDDSASGFELNFTEDTAPAESADAHEAATPSMESAPPLGDDAMPVKADKPQETVVAQAAVKEAPEAKPPVMPAPKKPAVAKKAAAAKNADMTPMPGAEKKTGTIAEASNTYYDGRIPTGPMADVGPRKVDPELEPASQFVVVKKAHEANDMESQLVAANRALKLKRYSAALDMFDELYKKNPRDQRILMGRAVAQQNSGMDDSAIRSYEELLDLAPNNADAMLNMLGLLRQQYPSVALRRLIDLHDKHPNNAGIDAQIGVTQADLGHNDEAIRYLGMAASLEPHNAQHMFNMAIIADRMGDTENAIKYYEKALELDAVFSSGRSIPRETIYDRLSMLRRR